MNYQRKYADLQYLHSGDETIEWMPLDEIKDASEYSEEYDYLGTTTVAGTKISLDVDAGCFAYFAPSDVHRPGMFRHAEKVKKIAVYEGNARKEYDSCEQKVSQLISGIQV